MFGMHGSYYFTKSISNLYGYFTSVGVDGKLAGYHVTAALELIPKPALIEKIFNQIIGSIFPCFSRNTHIPLVISNIESYLKEHSVGIKQQTAEKARFVINVLKIIETKRDKGLANLSKINQLRSSLPHAIIENKSQFNELFQKEESRYFNYEPLDPNNTLSQTVTALKNAPKQANWHTLPHDILYLICKKLNPYDLANVMRTCTAWKQVASDKGVWNTFKEDARYRSYFPLLPSATRSDNLWENLKSHQLLCKAIQTAARTKSKPP